MKCNNSIGSVRHLDENGYLYVDKSPVLKSGVLEYLGSEISDDKGEVDGVKVEPNKIYKVFLPIEELEKAKDTFNLKPITDEHTWLGIDGEDPKKYQQGMTGDKSFIEDGMLFVPLVFTGKEIIEDINAGKVELSASYTNELKKSDNPEYDFIAKDYTGNHIALVDRGRCGSNVRVLNSNFNQTEDLMPKKVKNEAILEINGKKVNLDKFFEEEAKEKAGGEDLHDESISQNEDKRKLIDEIGGICESAGMSEEDIRTIIGKAEKLSYNPSETSEADNGCGVKNEDEEEKVENDDEEVEEKKEEEKEEIKSENSFEKIYNKAVADVKASLKAEEDAKRKAYNSASQVLGDFNAYGMSAKDMLVKALNSAGISTSGEESEKELHAMLKVCNCRSKIDNNFSYGASTGSEKEYEFNIK